MSEVNRCVCTGQTFAELKLRAESIAGDFDTLREQTGCAQSCGLCEPYVRAMLRTGRTSFRPMDPAIREPGCSSSRDRSC